MKKNIYLLLFCALLFGSCKKDTSNPNAITVINSGVSGNTAGYLLERINTVIAQKPNLVIIMIGTNDAIEGTATYNNFTPFLSAVIDSLQHTGSSVMLLTPPPIQPWNTFTTDTSLFKGVLTMIYNLSVSKSCYYVDVNSYLNTILTTANSHQLYYTDGLHLSATGYSDIANFIYNYMKLNNIKKSKIICFGDSITYGIYMTGAGTATGNTYPAFLSDDLNSGK